ncbi:hypothetical protein, partial [Rhizobium sp. TRM95796]|uniref:hypothetical protein n=1 Tax=Rhizobium sp. TRM95796 TaxID=2979862 RepID=UPI0021E7B2C3
SPRGINSAGNHLTIGTKLFRQTEPPLFEVDRPAPASAISIIASELTALRIASTGRSNDPSS